MKSKNPKIIFYVTLFFIIGFTGLVYGVYFLKESIDSLTVLNYNSTEELLTMSGISFALTGITFSYMIKWIK